MDLEGAHLEVLQRRTESCKRSEFLLDPKITQQSFKFFLSAETGTYIMKTVERWCNYLLHKTSLMVNIFTDDTQSFSAFVSHLLHTLNATTSSVSSQQHTKWFHVFLYVQCFMQANCKKQTKKKPHKCCVAHMNLHQLILFFFFCQPTSFFLVFYHLLIPCVVQRQGKLVHVALSCLVFFSHLASYWPHQ